jgi:arylsulfatase A-like enzyme
MRRTHVLLLAFALAFNACSTQGRDKATSAREEETTTKEPNIVLIMADDLGFSDIGCYGGEINTPALDKLAENGLRFTQFYNTSRCCPTRASMLTGLYPHQAGIGKMTRDEGLPGYRGYLTENTVTTAELLKQAGYNTGMVGKWHVSPTEPLDKEDQLAWLAHLKEKETFSDTATYPTARGFDKYFGNIWGVVDYFDPFSLVNGTEPVESVPEDYYYTKAIGDSALAYVDEFARDDKPFFLYVAHCAPHWPLQALPEDIKKYEDVYKVGWDSIRINRYERMVELGLINKKTAPLSPRLFPDKKWENNPDREWDARAMAVHAAMIDRMDKTIGNLVQKLEETGELENTIIMFLSDNGASYERPSKYGPGFDRAGSTRDGREVTFPVEKDVLPGPQTTHAGIGPAWANVANTPFKYYKSKAHEGGIATPMIVHWPAGIKQKGAITEEPGHVIDLMATFLDLSNSGYPKRFEGREITPTVGKSLLPLIQQKNENIHDVLFWEHFGSRAVRQGDWKLVMLGRKADWELYNIAKDRTEVHNLVEEYPEKVEELTKLWEEMAHTYRVYPAP